MNLQRLRYRRLQQSGFTLVELLIAMAMAGIVLGAVYSTYKSQQDTYVVQEQVVEMQQNLRAVIYMMGRDIRMAGYDPTGSDLFGFVADLPSPNDAQGAITDTTGPVYSSIAFTMDLNDADGAVDDLDDEQSAYRINAGSLEKFSASNDAWQMVADNVDALDFVYLDQNGATTTTLEDIGSIEITLVVKTGRIDKKFTDTQTYQNQQGTTILPAQNDNFRRKVLTTAILCRNMGI